MAEKKEMKKGVISNYNNKPVTRNNYYYDYHDVSSEEKGFNEMFTDLAAFNSKLKKELEGQKTVKLKVSQVTEGLMAKAQFWQNTNKAKKEFEDYKDNGGKKDFEGFLKDCLECARKGNPPKRGRDVVGGTKKKSTNKIRSVKE